MRRQLRPWLFPIVLVNVEMFNQRPRDRRRINSDRIAPGGVHWLSYWLTGKHTLNYVGSVLCMLITTLLLFQKPLLAQVVTYDDDIRPRVFEPHCLRCHSSTLSGGARNGAPPNINWDTYELARPNASRAVNMVATGAMPPTGGLSQALRELMQEWQSDGFLESAPVPMPNIALNPTALDFNEAQVGAAPSQTLTITNDGDADLSVTDIRLTGSADFTLMAADTPFALSPGASEPIEVTYTPDIAGADSGAVEITSNDPDEPMVMAALSGVGVAPMPGMAVEPTQLDFGEHLLGQSANLTFDISNTGTLDLTIDDITLLDGENFMITAPDAPFSLTPGAIQTIEVDYAPMAPGSHSGAVEISGDDADNPLSTVSLGGRGLLLVATSGAQNPTTHTVSGNAQNLPLLQLQIDTGNEVLSITSVMMAFADPTGRTDASLSVSLVDDLNGNGVADTDEVILATTLAGNSLDTLILDLDQPFDIGPDETINLLLTLDVTATVDSASVLATPTPRNLYSRLGWWWLLPSLLGLLTLRRRHRRSPILVSSCIAMMLGLSLLLSSCSDSDDSGSQATFTATIPANGISGQGATSGAFSAPAADIVGATVTVSD